MSRAMMEITTSSSIKVKAASLIDGGLLEDIASQGG
jgi:adenylyl- and sulfurtransferase ThiI